jgi:uncharacterized lipoprotein YddW (UPF0748 family)
MKCVAGVVAWIVFGVGLASAAEVVLVRQVVTQPTKALDQGLVDGYVGRLARRLEQSGIAAITRDDSVLPADLLAGCKVVLFPYNPAVPEALTAALPGFVANGGKLGLFYCREPRLLTLVGVSAGEYRSGAELPKLEGVSLISDLLAGSPSRLRQRSWSIMVPVLPAAGAALVAGTWAPVEAPATGTASALPAFTLHPAGFTFGHVYLDEDPRAGELWLLALFERLLPGTWSTAVQQRLAAPLGFLDCPDLATLEPRARAAGRPEALTQWQRATELRRQAGDLAASGNLAAAQALAVQATECAGKAYVLTIPSRSGELRGAWIHSAYGIADWGWERTIKVLADNGFNAVFPNMCWGAVADYPSAVLPVHPDVATKGDQLQQCLDACRKYGIELHVWRVNWNMGQRTPAAVRQQFTDAGRVQVTDKGESSLFLAPHLEANQQLEREAMLEIVRKYPVDGIHFDYIRYPGEQCDFSSSARDAFTQWSGSAVAKWPDDCRPGGILREPYNRWRREQISRLVQSVSTGAHGLRPDIRVSAAVFGSWEGARESIAQDAVEWIDKGWLDFVCPMNYTTSDTYLASLLQQQLTAIGARVPLYCGIGAWEHPSAARTAGQIDLARRLGASGFVCFALTERFATATLPDLALGCSREPAGPLLPHHSAAALRFTASAPDPELEGAYPLQRRLVIDAVLPAPVYAFKPQIILLRNGYPSSPAKVLAAYVDDDHIRCTLRPREPGVYQIEVRGTVQAAREATPGALLARSLPVRVLSSADAEAARRRAGPPGFHGHSGLKVAVWSQGGYGAEPLLAALSLAKGLDVAPLFNLKYASLKGCAVVILPQPRTLTHLLKEDATWEPVREYVRRGGGVLTTHALVGVRGYPALFPEVASGGEPISTNEWRLCPGQFPETGLGTGSQRSTFTDLIVVRPGPAGTAVLAATDGATVAVQGRYGRGRYLACGLGLGIGPGDKDTPLTAAETALLVQAVGWLGDRH